MELCLYFDMYFHGILLGQIQKFLPLPLLCTLFVNAYALFYIAPNELHLSFIRILVKGRLICVTLM